jgi:hypothetical protein
VGILSLTARAPPLGIPSLIARSLAARSEELWASVFPSQGAYGFTKLVFRRPRLQVPLAVRLDLDIITVTVRMNR